MLVPKMFLHAALKFVLPEVMKLIKPLQEYKDEPNDADLRIDKLEKAIKSLDYSEQLASLAKNFEEYKESIEIKVVGIQAMVDKLDRDVDHIEAHQARLTDILTKLVKGPDA